MILANLHTRWDEANQRTIEIFIEALDRDIATSEEMQRDKVWINYKILENYVNELYTKYLSFTTGLLSQNSSSQKNYSVWTKSYQPESWKALI